MGKLLLLGLGKGLAVGLVVGIGIQVGLGWTAPGLLGGLIAACTGASAGLVGGKPPWNQEGVLESALKAAGGLLVGGLVFWGLTYIGAPLGFSLGFLDAEASWTAQPLLVAPLVGLLYGTLVELDGLAKPNKKAEGGETVSVKRGAKEKDAPKSTAKKLRDLDEFLAEVEGKPAPKKKKKSAD